MRILVAVSGERLQAAIKAALEPEGHTLIPALDGLAAMAAFKAERIELILTALDLPMVGGLELARVVRLSSRLRFVPVLMFTGGGGDGFFRQCLEAGVVEFIASPFDPVELRCRVDTLARLVRLQNSLLDFQARNAEELELVKHVLVRLAAQGARKDTPGFHMETLQDARINGDAWVHRESLPGVHFGMICDATGHGLMAGVSTIPVVMTFLAMVARDIPLSTIYLEINDKLQSLLPTGHFACLLLMRLDTTRGVLSVLNAGMPEVHLLRRARGLQSFPSLVMPAGIRGVAPEVAVVEADIAEGDRILACSDGLGDRATPEELRDRYLVAPAGLSHPEHCAAIRQLVAALPPTELAGDDLTWSLWEVPSASRRVGPGEDDPAPLLRTLVAAFEASFCLDPRVHGPRDVLPRVLALVQGFLVDHLQVQVFAMLLHEALTNAVEHGLLGLDSHLKTQGFEAFEQHRKLAMARAETGDVRFTLTLFHEEGEPSHRIRKIRVEVEDSGPGFDWRTWLEPRDPGLHPYGRGIHLLRELARDLKFNEAGNRVSFSVDCP